MGEGLPDDSSVRHKLHHVVFHAVVPEAPVLHVDDENVTNFCDDFCVIGTLRHARAVQMWMHGRVRQYGK